eukprot:CAMPEP_0116557712 /NCGR_PEP_ID=MMETSP0397-20121206/9393_1 /TAXON_ID=216820 /ORGANISM="Cyclophora tenuis, Strain ECT3854" /LENGTH=408 /DNA_ID=CAMNT_0004083201 /DNA_START=166 /DNA_END=1392 /DNA_ORIENTATION=+
MKMKMKMASKHIIAWLCCLLASQSSQSILSPTGSSFLVSAFPSPGQKLQRRQRLTRSQLMVSVLGPSDGKELKDDDGPYSTGTPTLTARMARIIAPIMSLALAGWWNRPAEALAHQQQLLLSTTSSSPARTTTVFDQTVQRYFPNAMPSTKVANLVHKFLVARNFKATNTLYGTSFCPDEINSKPNNKSLSSALQRRLSANQNGAFTLGGLGGLPFVGISGMKAFLSHCPTKEGKVIIAFGPHVGVSESGTVGKVERLGQTAPTTSCGAAIGAYQAIRANHNRRRHPPLPSISDFQEDYIIRQLQTTLDMKSVASDDEVASRVTKQMFGVIVSMLMEQLHACWQDPSFWENISEVVLVGGITINRGPNHGPQEDYFQPKVLQSFTKPVEKGERPSQKDYFQEVFPNRT